jgi:FkbH-like protein
VREFSSLYWLPEVDDGWLPALKANPSFWGLVSLAKRNLDHVRTAQLAAIARKNSEAVKFAAKQANRIAVLGTSTVVHLADGLVAAGLRREMAVDIHIGAYGDVFGALASGDDAVSKFAPTAVLLSFDARHVIGYGSKDAACDLIEKCWRLARESHPSAIIIQQTVLPVFDPLLGSNESRYSASPARLIATVNDGIRERAPSAGVYLVDVEQFAGQHGIDAWYNPVLWHKAKQEVSPTTSPLYGDLVMRVIAARMGLSSKCLVLDLDNTLWGGVIGDDGLGGIALGNGSAEGEAFLAFQGYAKSLAKRGIILAVCSKNDEANARGPFEKHPEMVLKNDDIACFVANWSDKAYNLKSIASTLNIGLDSLVFADDNPFERGQVRAELPMVAVPELPEDPSGYARCIADAGYFEAVDVTDDDLKRTKAYSDNRLRDELQTSASDMGAYLASLNMELIWGRVDLGTLPRVTQLINKTNQFNLTTKRYTEQAIEEVAARNRSAVLHFRLTDRFGDNGIICVVIGSVNERSEFDIDTWLMSCRVLKRGVERAVLGIVAGTAKSLGAECVTGTYMRTEKNGMVADHYSGLGFSAIEATEDKSRWVLPLKEFEPHPSAMKIVELQ